MYGLYEINTVVDDFLNQIENFQKEILVKSSFVVVSVSTILVMVAQ